MNNISFSILKATDNDYLAALMSLADNTRLTELSLVSLTASFAGGGQIQVPISKAAEHEQLRDIVSANGKVVRSFQLAGKNEIYVGFERTDNYQTGDSNGIHDRLNIVPGRTPESNSVDFYVLVAEAQKATQSFSLVTLGSVLGTDIQQHFAARELALTRLETLAANLVRDIDSDRRRMLDELQHQESDLSNKWQAKSELLERQHGERLAFLNNREKELEERKKTLDDRSSTHARRAIREKLKETILARQQSFSLSRDTKSRRGWVLAMYMMLLAAFGIPAGVLLYQDFGGDPKVFSPWLFGRQIGFSLGFAATAGFFLRWLNHWAQQHADEEFKLKQFELDFDRASFLVEMAFEWNDEKQGQIPPQLVDYLGSHLFGSRQSTDAHSMTALDAAASALLTSGSAATLTFPGGELKLDKAAIRKMTKSAPE